MISLVFKRPLPGRIDYGDTELAVENRVFGSVSFPTKSGYSIFCGGKARW